MTNPHPTSRGATRGPEWVVVQQFANGVDADLAVALLAGHDIPATLQNREFIGMDWAMAAAAGWIKVLVPPDRVGDALVVLRKANTARGADLQIGEPETLPDAETCLSCGGSLPVGDAVCDACGWSYLDEIDAEGAAVIASRGQTNAPALENLTDLPGARADRAGWKRLVVVLGLAALLLPFMSHILVGAVFMAGLLVVWWLMPGLRPGPNPRELRNDEAG